MNMLCKYSYSFIDMAPISVHKMCQIKAKTETAVYEIKSV
jgi:hypothetical protein